MEYSLSNKVLYVQPSQSQNLMTWHLAARLHDCQRVRLSNRTQTLPTRKDLTIHMGVVE